MNPKLQPLNPKAQTLNILKPLPLNPDLMMQPNPQPGKSLNPQSPAAKIEHNLLYFLCHRELSEAASCEWLLQLQRLGALRANLPEDVVSKYKRSQVGKP